MSDDVPNSQRLTEYLLGLLPEPDADRFDELSVVDDEFAEALKAAENDLVDAYVQGELTKAELERFRSYYLASPLRREKVEFAKGLRALAHKTTASHESAVRRDDAGWRLFVAVFKTPSLAFRWGMAFATVALLIAGGWLVIENTRLRQQASQMQARRDALAEHERELQKELEAQQTKGATNEQELARLREEQALKKGADDVNGKQPSLTPGVGVASFVLMPQLRGAERIQTVTIPPDKENVEMSLELEPNDYPAYRVALLDRSSSRVLWRSSQLRARSTSGGGKTVSVVFSAGLLKPQVYVLRVTGVGGSGASEIIGDYPFRVVR